MITKKVQLGGLRARQRGLSLITTLLFVLAALMLGVSVLSVNVMQERTIGNTKDRDLALQAAEAGLREAERELIALVAAGNPIPFDDNCTAGLCVPPSQRATPVSASVETLVDWESTSGTPPFRSYPASSPFPGVNVQPRYVIEKVGNLGIPSGESMKLGMAPSSSGTGYRITARAVGSRPETVVVLQSMYTVR